MHSLRTVWEFVAPNAPRDCPELLEVQDGDGFFDVPEQPDEAPAAQDGDYNVVDPMIGVAIAGPQMQPDNVVTKSSSEVGSDDGSSVQSHSTYSDQE